MSRNSDGRVIGGRNVARPGELTDLVLAGVADTLIFPT